MKGYPLYFATKEDFKNIANDFPNWRKRVKNELKKIQKIKDDKVTRAIQLIGPNDPESEWITEEIINPCPFYRQKGFKTKKELKDLINSITEEEQI